VRRALRVAELWGVGPATRDRLADAGIGTVADLAAYSPEELVQIAGTAMGRRLHRIAAGTDDAAIRAPAPRRSVSVSRATPARRPGEPYLRELCGELARRLRAAGRAGRQVHLSLHTDDGERGARARLPEHTEEGAVLADAVLSLAGEVGNPVARKVTITVTDLAPTAVTEQNPLPGL